MHDKFASLDEFLANILRGAAKILGCNSTNLIVFNEKTRSVQVRVGVTEVDYPMLAQMEQLLGVSFSGLSVPLDSATDSLLYRVWREGVMLETSCLADVVGSAIDREVIDNFNSMIGEHRYILVPAAGAGRNFGVLLFEKGGQQPFSRQQREVLLRYARRIGDIIENDLRGRPRMDIFRQPDASESSFELQLLQLTLGEPSPAVYIDRNFEITSCNEAFEKLTGKKAELLAGLPLGELFHDPAPVARILNQQLIYPGNPLHEAEAFISLGDGTLSSASVDALLLADNQKNVVGFLMLIKADQQGRYLSPERLIQQERLATMGEMAAQLAHEIRNPLVAIGATLEGLGHEMKDERHIKLLTSVVREITRMDMVLKKYLSPRENMSLAPVRVRELVEDVKRLLSGARKLAGKKISVEIDPLLEVNGDYDALKHVFFNLMLNALEASPDGGEVVCRSQTAKGSASIFIDDRGPGLAASSQKCFQPFFTVKTNGTGLGLPVCRKIAKAHSGAVSLSDREGGGCRATLVLPSC
jgi:two-component system, sporulation sensor kinase E